MKHLQLFVILAAMAVAIALNPDCPSYSQVTTCTPKCKEDADCVSLGGKCCSNLCNAKSCVTKGNTNKSGDNKYSSNAAAGSYCGNVKCNSFEKCDLDKTTKRQKCVRA